MANIYFKPKVSTRKKVQGAISKTLVYIVLSAISIVWILPFLYLIVQSFAPEYQTAVLIPPIDTWTLDNYRSLFDTSFIRNLGGKEVNVAETYPFWRWYLNTLGIALITAVLQTVLTLMSAYAFSRLQFKTRKSYMKLILVIGMFPGFLGMIINYWILYYLGLATGYGAMAGLILVYIGGCVMNYYIAKGFFDTISKSLDEAAMIDGANKNTIFWRVIMPLSKPIVVFGFLPQATKAIHIRQMINTLIIFFIKIPPKHNNRFWLILLYTIIGYYVNRRFVVYDFI